MNMATKKAQSNVEYKLLPLSGYFVNFVTNNIFDLQLLL